MIGSSHPAEKWLMMVNWTSKDAERFSALHAFSTLPANWADSLQPRIKALYTIPAALNTASASAGWIGDMSDAAQLTAAIDALAYATAEAINGLNLTVASSFSTTTGEDLSNAGAIVTGAGGVLAAVPYVGAALAVVGTVLSALGALWEDDPSSEVTPQQLSATCNLPTIANLPSTGYGGRVMPADYIRYRRLHETNSDFYGGGVYFAQDGHTNIARVLDSEVARAAFKQTTMDHYERAWMNAVHKELSDRRDQGDGGESLLPLYLDCWRFRVIPSLKQEYDVNSFRKAITAVIKSEKVMPGWADMAGDSFCAAQVDSLIGYWAGVMRTWWRMASPSYIQDQPQVEPRLLLHSQILKASPGSVPYIPLHMAKSLLTECELWSTSHQDLVFKFETTGPMATLSAQAKSLSQVTGRKYWLRCGTGKAFPVTT